MQELMASFLSVPFPVKGLASYIQVVPSEVIASSKANENSMIRDLIPTGWLILILSSYSKMMPARSVIPPAGCCATIPCSNNC